MLEPRVVEALFGRGAGLRLAGFSLRYGHVALLLASLALSFTMVPVLFKYLMRRAVQEFDAEPSHPPRQAGARAKNILVRFQEGFERGFEKFRESYRDTLSWTLSQARLTVTGFVVLIVVSALLFPLLGRDFFRRFGVQDVSRSIALLPREV